MKCKDIHKNLLLYPDNELEAGLKASIEKHLEECDDCRGFSAFLKEEMQIIGREKKQKVSPFFFTRLSSRLDEKQDYRQQTLWNRVAQPAFFTLILVAAIYGGLRMGSDASLGKINQPDASSFQLVNDFEAEPIESFLLNEL